MKIDLYFKDCLLGQLSKEDERYAFKLDAQGYDKMKSFPSVMFAFEVAGLGEGEFDCMPQFFMDEFVNNIKVRSDIKASAAIVESDDDMTILYKYAALKQNDYKFHLKQCK